MVKGGIPRIETLMSEGKSVLFCPCNGSKEVIDGTGEDCISSECGLKSSHPARERTQ